MRVSFNISSSTGVYNVLLGEGLVQEVVATQAHRIFLVDSRLLTQVAFVTDPIIAIDATEENKSLEQIAPVIEALKRHGATRDTEIVAVGGGIIQDIATFVASIYMRGLRWHYCPTTLLGMVDSCIGGKSSINVGALKNLVGNFHPPASILIDLAFVQSLSAEQQTSGLMESVKICYARGAQAFAAYLDWQPAAPLKSETAFAIIEQSLTTKKWFIEVDEFDRAERLLLNFGHTFGHAVESATRFAIPHGIAVGVGILMAYRYAQVAKILTPEGDARAERLVAHVQELLQPMRQTLAPLVGVTADELLKHFESDKKHSQSHYRVIVPAGNGDLQRLSLERTPVVQALIGDAFAQGAALAINGGA
ncbi:3-dehydroquinate synthase [Pseudomonas mosselii]|uniref:3-dehydroquinate synthase n=1 Tax=Pseudomonas mosselii TaxID=78327 RepID=A0AA42RW86_9PSED|nr:3-dehydroquinate synthase [Pseudomonas mosselii]MDH1630675.1 3-dehydroquinate synthase [Pseudomonas mosselii]